MPKVGAPLQPPLFDLGARPTTRAVAERVRVAGVEGLSDAVQRADGTRYQDVICRTALNRVEGMPFRWTLNPYRGCTHGCHYCFARRYQPQLEMDPGDEFSSVVLVKVNFPDVLRAELARPTWDNQLVAFGTATDPYQPIEGQYRLTRQSLEVLASRSAPVGLLTRGPLAVRDADVLADMSRRSRSTVTFSIPTVDEEAWARLEPGTAPPRQRLRAVRALNDAGVDTGVLMAPIVPGITSHPAKLERTVREIAAHGATCVGTMLMYLEGGTREHFLGLLEREYPHLVERYGRLYAGKHAEPGYAQRFRAVMSGLTARYGGRVGRRRDPARQGRADPRPEPAPSQPRLRL